MGAAVACARLLRQEVGGAFLFDVEQDCNTCLSYNLRLNRTSPQKSVCMIFNLPLWRGSGYLANRHIRTICAQFISLTTMCFLIDEISNKFRTRGLDREGAANLTTRANQLLVHSILNEAQRRLRKASGSASKLKDVITA